MSTATPSFGKLTLAIAAGIVLAVLVLFFGSAIIAGAVESNHRADQARLQEADRKAVVECRPAAIKAAKSMDEVVELSRPCEVLENAYAVKWGPL